MKGVVVAAVIAATLLGCIGMALANAPIVPPVQYEQFCESQQISGSGVVDMSTSIIDKKIALEFYDVKNGDGDLELSQEQVYSQNSDKINRSVSVVNNGNGSNLNLFDTTKLTYAGATPLVGGKFINSKGFYGGIGAQVQEMYSVNELEQDEQTFFSSTTPYDMSPYSDSSFMNELKNAGRNGDRVNELMNKNGYNPSHLVGVVTKNTFNGTWGTDAKMHKIFYKDIKAHEMFTGKFEASKTLKFHENPVPEAIQAPCAGVDC